MLSSAVDEGRKVSAAGLTVEELPSPGEVLLAANRHYQRPPEASVEAYQLTYDDLAGCFPWDPGYANAPDIQPRPGTWRA